MFLDFLSGVVYNRKSYSLALFMSQAVQKHGLGVMYNEAIKIGPCVCNGFYDGAFARWLHTE